MIPYGLTEADFSIVWLAWPPAGWDLTTTGPIVAPSAETAQQFRDYGWTVLGPYTRAAER